MKKIVVVGVESTGKSQLCQALAEHYHCVWVAEYARTYLNENGSDYTFDDLLPMAQGQVRLEEAALQKAQGEQMPFVFVDTDLQVFHVWSEVVFNRTHEWIERQRATRTCDLYLLTSLDLPWVEDELREIPDLKQREAVMQKYEQLLAQQSTPWAHVSGTGIDRVQSAIYAIEKTFNS